MNSQKNRSNPRAELMGVPLNLRLSTNIQELEDDADDVDADAQDYAAMLKELGNDDGDWEGETGLGKAIFY